jgi:intraflagellar transport protein 140
MSLALGDWKKSIEIAQNNDRIHLKNTYYKTAKMFEVSKDFDNAIKYYELANCHMY